MMVVGSRKIERPTELRAHEKDEPCCQVFRICSYPVTLIRRCGQLFIVPFRPLRQRGFAHSARHCHICSSLLCEKGYSPLTNAKTRYFQFYISYFV